jgi:hypothetical protein
LTRLARTAAKWLTRSPLTPICAHEHAPVLAPSPSAAPYGHAPAAVYTRMANL